jgi:fatty-acyl-CoA synthase
VNVLPALATGATIALRRNFSASGFSTDVRRFGATYFNYVGRALAYILSTEERYDDRDNRLRLGFGTEASVRDVARFERRFGCSIRENYGSSEGVIAIRRRPETPPDAMGLPPQGSPADVVVVDPESRAECPRAVFDANGTLTNAQLAIGEIVDRLGAQRFEGYYNNAEATAHRVRHGWFWSGDLGYRDAAGWFYFAGRTADWLRVDSENFAAAPLERILNDHDQIAISAVFPVPDARTGDQVMAALEVGPNFDPDALFAYLRAHPDLGTKWFPRFIRVVDRMPQTANGKLNKQPLRLAAWCTSDPVFWQPASGAPYQRLHGRDVSALADVFAQHGRSNLLPQPVG